jgi:hypothetical protein
MMKLTDVQQQGLDNLSPEARAFVRSLLASETQRVQAAYEENKERLVHDEAIRPNALKLNGRLAELAELSEVFTPTKPRKP